MTNLALAPEAVYAIYRQRGDVENRHKELKDSLGLGRTSCPRFLANQFRVLLTATAYILFQTLQQHAQAHGLRGRPGRHAAGASDQARGLDHALGAPDRAAPAARLPLARALAAGGAARSAPGPANRRAAAPDPPRPTAGMVSLPGPAASAARARLAASAGRH